MSKIPLPFDYAVEQALDSGIVLYSALEEGAVPSSVPSHVPSPVQAQVPVSQLTANNVPFPSWLYKTGGGWGRGRGKIDEEI